VIFEQNHCQDRGQSQNRHRQKSHSPKQDLELKKFIIGPLSTNCYLAYNKKSRKGILIDPAVYDTEVSEYIADNGIEISYTLNTHGHADHIAGNAGFDFPILIHELDELCLRDPMKSLAFFAGEKVPVSKAYRLLKDGDTIDLDGLEFEVIHTPGHTPGGISVKCGNILFSGDTLFFEGIGRSDCPGGDHDAQEHTC